MNRQRVPEENEEVPETREFMFFRTSMHCLFCNFKFYACFDTI